MNILFLALLFQTAPLPPRAALENPAVLVEIPKKLKKDYDKTWARFVAGNEDSNVLRDADKLLKKQNSFVPALLVQAYVDLYLGLNDAAERQFGKVLDQDPQQRTALFYLAELTFSRDDFLKASGLYGRLLDLDNGRPDLEMKRQKALLLATDNLLRSAAGAEGEGRLAEAEDLYRQALQIAPGEPVLHGQLGNLLFQEKKWDEALTSFRRQVELGVSDEQVQRHIADALTELGRPDEARDVLASLRKADSLGHEDELGRRTAELEDFGRWGADIDQFRKISSAEAITREQLATLILRYFPQVSDQPQTPVFIADIQDSQAWRDIETVVAVGLFDLTPNHAIGPAETMSRGDFAMAMARLIRLLGINAGEAPSITPPDLPPSHVIYRDAQLVLQCGLLTLDNAGQFDVSGQLTGKQAVSAAERLLAFVREKPQ